MMQKKQILAAMIASFLLGAMWFVALRATLYQNDAVHYHANFALFVNGQRDKLDNFTLYEEVQACNDDNTNNPRSRAHMHKPDNHVVHVHDQAATWGSFFANMGYGLSDKTLTTPDGIYVDGQDGKKLTFLLNGQPVTTITNRVVGNKDVLLLSYGAADQASLQEQYRQIPQDAERVNYGTDPASCSGAEKTSLGSRLMRALDPTK